MKKFLLFLLAVVLWVLWYLYFTDRLSLFGLKSDVLGSGECSAEYLTEKSESYKQIFIQRQEARNQIELIKAELVKLAAQKNTSEADSESIIAETAMQQKSLEDFEKQAEEYTVFIDQYEACKQSLIIQWVIPGAGNLVSDEVVVSGEVTPALVTEAAIVPEPQETTAEIIVPVETN